MYQGTFFAVELYTGRHCLQCRRNLGMPKNGQMELVEVDACPRRNALGVGRIPEPRKKAPLVVP